MNELIQSLLFLGHMVWACGIDLSLGAIVAVVRHIRLTCSFLQRSEKTPMEQPEQSA